MTYFVIYAEWSYDYISGHSIVGVYKNFDNAVQAMKERVDHWERIKAKECGFEIYEDSQTCFDAGIDEYYSRFHAFVTIEQVTTNEDKENEN